VHVIESGTGLPGRCNNNELKPFGGTFSAANPFTPDLVTFSQDGTRIGQPLGKPTAAGGGFQADGPAVGMAFEHDFDGGTLFASDSNQGARGAPGKGNNTSRIVTIDPRSGRVQPFIPGLPTGDHPTEQVTVKDGWIYWSQGSATNSGVTGHDNGAGGAQHDIACQDITLSQNTWDSGDGHVTSGYSNHGVARPGATVKAFEDATAPGMCTGAILRARIDARNPADTIEPYSWGYRNPFGLRFSPLNHPLEGELMVTENGEDERGARPTNNAPDRLAVARQNEDGTPDYHGWPDRFGFLDSTQRVFNPIGGPGDDNPGAVIGKPVLHVFAFPPQPPVAPLALEPSDVAVVGLDFAPSAFVGGVVKPGAALISREGDFGFSPENGDPEAGHDVELVNFKRAQLPGGLPDAPGRRLPRLHRRVGAGLRPEGPRHQPPGDRDVRSRWRAVRRRLRRGARLRPRQPRRQVQGGRGPAARADPGHRRDLADLAAGRLTGRRERPAGVPAGRDPRGRPPPAHAKGLRMAEPLSCLLEAAGDPSGQLVRRHPLRRSSGSAGGDRRSSTKAAGVSAWSRPTARC
jgi:hypothetical protein